MKKNIFFISEWIKSTCKTGSHYSIQVFQLNSFSVWRYVEKQTVIYFATVWLCVLFGNFEKHTHKTVAKQNNISEVPLTIKIAHIRIFTKLLSNYHYFSLFYIFTHFSLQNMFIQCREGGERGYSMDPDNFELMVKRLHWNSLDSSKYWTICNTSKQWNQNHGCVRNFENPFEIGEYQLLFLPHSSPMRFTLFWAWRVW